MLFFFFLVLSLLKSRLVTFVSVKQAAEDGLVIETVPHIHVASVLKQTSQLLLKLDVGNNIDVLLNSFCIFFISSLCLNALPLSEDSLHTSCFDQ